MSERDSALGEEHTWTGLLEKLDDADYPPPDRGEVSVPWIGPRYAEHRVCAIAINANKYGQLGAHWWINRSRVARLREGRTGEDTFGYQVGRYLAVLLAHLNGETVAEDKVGPALAAEAWESCSFLEAVKCSPARGVSTPTKEMKRNCPSLYLTEELRLLSPRVPLAVGHPAWAALKDCLHVTLHEERPGFERGTTILDGATMEVVLVYHPSYQWWRRSLPPLVGSLSTHPMMLSTHPMML